MIKSFLNKRQANKLAKQLAELSKLVSGVNDRISNIENQLKPKYRISNGKLELK